jgi:hypothetical protein
MLHIFAGLGTNGTTRVIDLGASAYGSQSSGRLRRWWRRVDVIGMDFVQAQMVQR